MEQEERDSLPAPMVLPHYRHSEALGVGMLGCARHETQDEDRFKMSLLVDGW